MPSPSRRTHPLPLLGATLLASAIALFSPVTVAGGQSAADKVRAEKQLQEVRDRMEALARTQAETADRRDSVNAELARRARALAKAADAVRATEAELAAKQHDLDLLEAQRQALQQSLDSQRAAIGDLLRATYALGKASDLRLLLGDQDVARVARALAYSKYFQEDRLEHVQQLMADLGRLQSLQDAITAQQQVLQATHAQQAAQAKTLAEQRAAQQKLARRIDATYKDENARLAALKQNEQSLGDLVAKLQQAIDQAARESARSSPDSGTRAGHPMLANIRGSLPWPAAGAVHSYGNGVLIRAPGGSEVHAVARGRVVFANFLRGYGMLVILDHGDGWMSMYGNNEALLHRVGDVVNAGAAIGTAMAPTGVNTGAYFELRRHNKPVDPRGWLARHR